MPSTATAAGSPDDDDFSALLRAARTGTDDDRASLLESFRDYLRGVAAGNIGKKQIGQLSASDIVQSVIIDANEAFEKCRASTFVEFKAWLRQILLNDIINRHRKLHSKKRDVNKERQLGSKLELVDDLDSPSRQVMRVEDKERLAAALSKLPEEQKLVVELFQRDRLSFTEIAKRLDRTPGSTRALWTRAIDALAKLLQEDESK
ncbi:MAG: sigma-70 family RNA polymerase sigma factor [Planctomycetaceae bacterium]